MSLPDGVYLGSPLSSARNSRPAWFVSSGNYDEVWPLHRAAALPITANEWTRIADLPDLRMAEPTQIGYPVMAGCNTLYDPHLFTRRNVGRDGQWPWECEHDYVKWSDLTDPRDLTADEIREHDLWTGGAR